jgi:NTE family protein
VSPKRFKVGLALGGGAARGLAHIGVLKVLQAQKIPIDLIAGTSIGSLVGGAFAILGDATKVEERFKKFVKSPNFRQAEFEFLRESRRDRPSMIYSVANMIKKGIFYSFSMARNSFISKENFQHNIHSLVEDVRIENLKIPFGAVAVDLDTGGASLIRSGPLRSAVCASSAIPGLMPPIPINGRTFIDGGWVSKVPVIEAFKMGADMVIAADISQELEDTRNLRKGLEILVRAEAIKADALRAFQCHLADIVIRPPVGDVHWADFVDGVKLIERGERAAMAKVEDIKAMIEKSKWKTRLGFSRGKRLSKTFF